MSNLKAYIRARRAELGISQRALAELCDLPIGTIAGIESGRDIKAPRPATLQKLANGLKTTYAWLDGLVRELGEAELKASVRWEEDYTYRMFDELMQSPHFPESERMWLVAKLRTLWQSHAAPEST
ncbi:MAG: helix-turn-helix transcriptional regulator [Candidatus Sericytochromatia bacterium]|nr:helix-turn-helix transcriptional regulator [Candidatus Sericytochromatia bacterium]